jgi:hypothetical protein
LGRQSRDCLISGHVQAFLAFDRVTPRWRNTAQWARNDLREQGLIRDDIMLAHLYHPGAVTGYHPGAVTGYHPGAVTGQHTPRSIWEITEKGRQWLRERTGTAAR